MSSGLMVADYILSHSDISLTPLHIIKLVYISHGYTLAKTNKSLIEEKVEAWEHGPVIPTVYHAFKDYRGNPITSLYYCAVELNSDQIKDRREAIESEFNTEQRSIMDRVIEQYGNKDGTYLSYITHKKDTPWSRYYKKGKKFVEIPNEVIKEHYTELCNAEQQRQ